MSYTCYNCFREKQNNETCPFCGYVPENEKEKYPNALRPGSILNGKYIVGRVIGQGGFGITYIAKDYKTGERVAIKEYLPSEFAGRNGNSVQAFSKDQKENFEYGKEQFLSEAKTLAAFNGDEHIVRIYSFFEENNTAYFAMEYVDGLALDKYMAQQGGRLTVAEANRFLLPLMESLNKVHAKGIVHRDIAPDNIIVTKDGSVKLIDFGAARYSTGEKSRSLDVILKHGFAPPEQYMRRGCQGPFTDVYALAATYYYAITGKLLPDSVERTFEDTIMLPHTLGVKISRKQEDALLKALEVNAADRYQNMGDFHREMVQASGIKEEASSKQKAGKAQQKTEPNKKSGKKTGLIAVAMLAALCAALYLLTTKVILPNRRYIEAQNLLASGEYEAAEAAFLKLGDFKDSEEMVRAATTAYNRSKWAWNGNVITFGRYEQDNDASNGKENIEWIVLDVQEDRALLLSRYALDCKRYNSTRKDVSWETCTLRSWMNDSFLKEAFTPEEQELIPGLSVSADVNPKYGTDPGESTADQVFLLSITEVDRYLDSEEKTKCAPTEFAVSQGTELSYTYKVNGKATCWWWLRSPGNISRSAAGVSSGGAVDYIGNNVNIDHVAVRPALWVNLNNKLDQAISSAHISEDSKVVNTEEKGSFDTVGSIVNFGAYEQDNDTSDGKEAIEWIVLDVKDNKALLLSHHALDFQPFVTKGDIFTWEESFVRQWLNDSFINDAFSGNEQEMILTTKVSADRNPKSNTDPGKTTEDQIFLLSITEAEQLFASNEERQCAATAYAMAEADNSSETCWWWLRSPGRFNYMATEISNEGAINNFGKSTGRNGFVRPSLWVDLEAVKAEKSAAFEQTNDTIDSASQFEIKELKEASVGDYVLFGRYEQDNDNSSGREDIEWLVLDIQENRALLLSRYALDCQPYNAEYEDVTWETCTLRRWLNKVFINNAFSSEEQIAILSTTLDNKDNQVQSPLYNTHQQNRVLNTDGGNNTEDRIFLLSSDETIEYLPTNKEKACQVTEYAINQGASHSNESAWWWLRSPGGNSSSASYVKGEAIYNAGRNVNGIDAVRPALWIDLNKVG